MPKFRILYSATGDEHNPDVRDDGIIIEAENDIEAYKIAARDSRVKGELWDAVEEE